MQRRNFLLLSSASLLGACVRPGEALTNATIDPQMLAAAQARANDGVLRAEDVRGGFANGTVGDQLATVQPRTIVRLGSGNIADYLGINAPLPVTLPPVRRQDLNGFYLARSYMPYWFQGGDWTDKAHQTFTALVGAPVDGLLPRDYLPGERTLPPNLKAGSPEVAQIDMELTAGLLRYLKDAQEGRQEDRSRFDALSALREVLSASSIDAGLETQVNQGQMYGLLRERGKRQVQFLNGAEFDAYRVTLESLRTQDVPITFRGKYIVSNIAAQEVLAMRDGRVELGMNMVVGRPTRQTPVSDDNIVSIKFSPDWTAPRSIVRSDLIPRAPLIFEEMGIEVRRGGQVIDPKTIVWNEAAARNYEFIQPPGPLNVLGGVRFTLQNSSAIYMHDSPDRVLFNKVNRIYSSGCMRLEKSTELALWLLKDQDPSWTLEKVQEAMVREQSEFVQLETRVPIKTVYLEAWPSHKGGLRIVPDIYGRNVDLRRRLGITARVSNDPADLSAFRTSIF